MLAAREGTNASRDFYSGLGVSLAAMLVSPKFIFDIEVLEPVSARSTLQRLDAYSKASRLSLFLWNTTPDAMLLDAAERRDLHNASSVAGQVDRLLASHRAGARIKAFFSEASGDADGCGTDPVSLEYEHRLKPAVAACLTRRVVEIGLRRRLADAESAWLADLTARLVSGGYDMRPLLREIATSAAFFHAP
jgi:hypothetical protein